MPKKGYKFTPEQVENFSRSHLGQRAWNTGMGGCKKGHDPSLYIPMPSGVYVCLGCKRENGAKYRQDNQEKINKTNRLKRYGMTQEDYDRILSSQGGLCAICGISLNDVCFRIDHDHSTGDVRGLLCASCNTGIGLLKDSEDILNKAIEYIKKHNDP